MAKGLVISPDAYLDIDRIIEFNNNRNKSDTYSKRFIKELYEKFNQLIQSPFIGIKTSRASVLLLIWNSFYMFYKVTDNSINILSIYHQKENINL